MTRQHSIALNEKVYLWLTNEHLDKYVLVQVDQLYMCENI